MKKLENREIWIGNGKLVLPHRTVPCGSVLIRNGHIAELNRPCPPGAHRFNADGGCILPGFIDIHLHGGGGADFMDAEPEAFYIAAATHCQHGTTAMVPTTMTCDDALLEKVIHCFLKAKDVPSQGAELLGLHLEGPYFAAAGKGAQPVEGERGPARENLEHFIRLAQGNILRWDASPEIPNAALFAAVMRENGIMASAAHTGAVAEEAYAAFDAGFSHVTHFYSATSASRKINGIVYGGLNEATLLRDDITIEIIADGCHIPLENMVLAYRIKGADKMALITDAMRAAGTDAVHSVLGAKDSGVPVVIKDGVAQLPDFSFYAGSIATMDRALRVAHVRYGIPLTDVSRMLSLTPAKLSGCADRKGSLEPGKDADVVVMNKSFSVRYVFARGSLRYENPDPDKTEIQSEKVPL